jgi:hypothetical protein
MTARFRGRQLATVVDSREITFKSDDLESEEITSSASRSPST